MIGVLNLHPVALAYVPTHNNDDLCTEFASQCTRMRAKTRAQTLARTLTRHIT